LWWKEEEKIASILGAILDPQVQVSYTTLENMGAWL
jgi:hypothetical protein